MLEEILTSASIREIEDQHGAGTYYKRPIVIVRGQGAHLWDESGREYIDCVGGQGAANIGHQNPYVNKAIQEQSEKLINCTELFYNDQRARLLEKLGRICPSPISRFFLCNSGAESIEGAFKFARLATGRTEIVATMRGTTGKPSELLAQHGIKNIGNLLSHCCRVFPMSHLITLRRPRRPSPKRPRPSS